MRSYGQYCALAKALDVLGDRWTLLVVRELLLRGPSRYTDLRDGLPGIATNLLAERLRGLEVAGVVEREEAAPPVATTLYRLTPRGQELRAALLELGRWGAPFMVEETEGEHFRSHWLSFPAEMVLTDRSPDRPPVRLEVRTGDRPIVLETGDGGVRLRPAGGEEPDAVVTGEPPVVLGTLVGALELDEARERGLGYVGDPDVLARLRPSG